MNDKRKQIHSKRATEKKSKRNIGRKQLYDRNLIINVNETSNSETRILPRKSMRQYNKEVPNVENSSNDVDYTNSNLSSDNEELDELNLKKNILKSRYDLQIILFFIIIIIIIIFILVYVKYVFKTDVELSYIEKFNKLKSEFPNQSNISWKMLNSSLSKQILKRRPIEKPAVIILVGLSDKVNNFFERLISVVPTECPIYVVKTDAQKTDDLKMHLNIFLDESKNHGIHCAYLPDIDKIPPALGQFLQGLTDELNAKYKEMIYIFSLKINSDFNNLNSFPKTDRDATNFLLDKLREKWEHVERFVALHTRLLVNVVMVV